MSFCGLKENVIVGHLVPAGTGLRKYRDLVVGSKRELEALRTASEALGFDDGGDGSGAVASPSQEMDPETLAAINRRLG